MTTRARRHVRRSTAIRTAAAVTAVIGLAVGAVPAVGASISHGSSAATYQLSLGDSVAAGIGASTDALRYVNQIAAAESSSIPGLALENLACSGATTRTMLDGPGCSYSTGSQLGDAEAFLRSHPGHVAYVTLDIGINDIVGCLPAGSAMASCVADGMSQIAAQLPSIIRGVEAADPGVPVFGMDYYSPFLAEWVLGGASGPAIARRYAPIYAALNSSLTQIYGAGGAVPVDVQGSFADQDFAMNGSWDGVAVPQNVARSCEWTHMCDGSGYYIHPNDTGHTLIAEDFEHAINRWSRGGGRGTWLADSIGGVHTVGNATTFGSMAGRPHNKPVVTMAATNDGQGYWLVASDGGIFAFGDAGFFGSTGGLDLTRPIVGFAPTSDDRGYWEVASDGGVFAFGDATFLGSLGGTHLNRPVVGMAQTGSDQGYWLVAADGGIFAFGDAGFFGSTGNVSLNRPVVGMAATVDGNGYWLVGADGGIYSGGDALFHGSTGNVALDKSIVGMAVAPDGYGYTLGSADGGLFNGGSAGFNGSLAGSAVAPIVAIAGT